MKQDTKPFVVLIHGFLETSLIWKELNLESHFNCIYFDLPGHGDNQNDSFDSISSIASDLRVHLNKTGITSYQVFGHSLGGYVALELAAMDNRCAKITLVNSNFWTDDEYKKSDRKRVAELVTNKKELFIREAIPNLFASPNNHQDQIEKMINDAMKISSKVISDLSLAMSQRKDFTNWVEINQKKVRIIQGELDKTVTLSQMQKQVLKMGELKMYYLNDAHMSWCENQQTLEAILKK